MSAPAAAPTTNGETGRPAATETTAVPVSNSPFPLPFFPAGLQLLHDYEKQNLRSLNHVFFLAAHWAFVRGGFRRTTVPLNLPGNYEIQSALSTAMSTVPTENVTTGSPAAAAAPSSSQQGGSTAPSTPAEVLAAISEMPEPGWADRIDTVREKPLTFAYINPLALEEGYYRIEFYALNDIDMIVRLSNRFNPAARKQFLAKAAGGIEFNPKDTQASSFVMTDFVRFGPEFQTAFDIFYKASILENHIFKYLFEDIGLPVYGIVPHGIGMYDDTPAQIQARAAAAAAQQPSQSRGRDYREDYGYNYDERPYPRRPLPNPGGFGGPL